MTSGDNPSTRPLPRPVPGLRAAPEPVVNPQTLPTPLTPLEPIQMDTEPEPRTSRPRCLAIVETMAGLLSGGMLLLGLILLAARFVAPAVDDGATGPTLTRLVAHLLVGVLGETGVLLRRRMPTPTRTVIAVATIVAAVAVLAIGWWGF